MIAVREGYIIVEFAVYGRQMCYCESVVDVCVCVGGASVKGGETFMAHTHTHIHTHAVTGNFPVTVERVHDSNTQPLS